MIRYIIFLVSFLSPAVREAAVQRRHQLYRDSIILNNSDPSLDLLGTGENSSSVDWAAKFGSESGDDAPGVVGGGASGRRRRQQVVSMIQLDNLPLPFESCLDVPGVELIPEEAEDNEEGDDSDGEEPGEGRGVFSTFCRNLKTRPFRLYLSP